MQCNIPQSNLSREIALIYRGALQHAEPEVVAAKIWLIGRAYAAAIERRKIKDGFSDFYTECVVPTICDSDIDSWLEDLRAHRKITKRSIKHVAAVHKHVTDLFKTISGQNKRSLASKYLHFHAPNLFFIFDSIAQTGMQSLLAYSGHKSEKYEIEDAQYGVFVTRCLNLQQYIFKKHDVFLNPRQIDRLLLIAGKKAKKNLPSE